MVIILLILLYTLNIIDYCQTISVVSFCGLAAELNPVAHFLLENNCAWVFKILLFPIGLIVLERINRIEKKIAIWAICLLLAMYSVVVINNFIVMFQLGII